MKNVFSADHTHTVTRADINFYTVPFVHPRRSMREHDFIYLLQGEWSLGQNGKTYNLKKDSLIILFAGNTHYGITPCEADTKTMYFHVSLEDGDAAFDDSDPPAPYVETLVNAAGNPKIKKLFENVVSERLSGEQRKANLYFELLLCELNAQNTHSQGIGLAQSIRNMIHSYPEKFFSNEELAKAMHVSIKTAETKFKAAFGMPIHQYILDFKIKEAISYFDRFDEISVKQVAYNLGFCDEYHFSKQFYKRTGMSPRSYKKSIKSLNGEKSNERGKSNEMG